MSYQNIFQPKDNQDHDAVEKLTSLSTTDLAAIFPALLPWLVFPIPFNYSIREHLIELLVSRLNESPPSSDDPLAAAVSSAINVPAMTPEAAELKRSLVRNIIPGLHKDRMEPYRDALSRLATRPTEPEAASDARIWGTVTFWSAEVLKYMNATQAWVPAHKSDEFAQRSLEEMVHTAEEMRPLVPGLLEWLQDPNWPPYSGCAEQLMRFPEVTIDPLREVLRGDDAWWSGNLLMSLLEGMPGELRERARPEVEGLAQGATDEDLLEAANSCLKVMDDWEARNKM
ncbi:hypothetical protein C8R43DRAFT_1203058 [Mycena crocata]|nr:hypothetical protein C8R43DRAFT_1203058 [Mycena crocata]